MSMPYKKARELVLNPHKFYSWCEKKIAYERRLLSRLPNNKDNDLTALRSLARIAWLNGMRSWVERYWKEKSKND